LIVGVISTAFVGLISPLGFLADIIFLVVVCFSEVLLGKVRLKIFRTLFVIFASSGLISFWYNPKFLKLFFESQQGQGIVLGLSKIAPISLFAIPVLMIAGFLIFERRPDLQSTFVASFFSIIFLAVWLAGEGFMPSHPARYQSELGISLAFLGSVLILVVFDFLKLNLKIGKIFGLDALRQQFWGNIIPVVVFLLAIAYSVVKSSNLNFLAQESVLGLWEGVKQTDLWLAREQADGPSFVLGYSVSVLTVISLFIIGFRSLSFKTKAESVQNFQRDRKEN